MSKAITGIFLFLLAASSCSFGSIFFRELVNEQISTSETYGEKIKATEEALATLKAEATIDAARATAGSTPGIFGQVECGTEEECNNSGIHRYQLTVEEFRECIGTGGDEVLQEFEFKIKFLTGAVSIEHIGFDWFQEFQSETQNTYSGTNENGSIQKLTFTTDGFLVETLEDDAKCLVYTLTD